MSDDKFQTNKENWESSVEKTLNTAYFACCKSLRNRWRNMQCVSG